MLPVTHGLYLALWLFAVGLGGALLRRSLIAALIGVQLMLLALALWFCVYARMFVDASGQAIALLVALAGLCELAVIVAIVLRIASSRGDADALIHDWSSPEGGDWSSPEAG